MVNYHPNSNLFVLACTSFWGVFSFPTALRGLLLKLVYVGARFSASINGLFSHVAQLLSYVCARGYV